MNVSIPTADEIHDLDDLDYDRHAFPYAGQPSPAARPDEVQPVDDGDQDRIILANADVTDGANVSAEVTEAEVAEQPAEVPAATYVLAGDHMFIEVDGHRKYFVRGDVLPDFPDDDVARLTRARAIVKAGELVDRSDEVPLGTLPPSQLDQSWHTARAKGLLHPAPPKRKSSDDEAPPSSAWFPPGALTVGP